MRSKHFLAMTVVGSGLALVGFAQTGCGSTAAATGGSGTASGSTVSTGTHTTSSHGSTSGVSTSTSTSGGGGGGTGGAVACATSFSAAVPLTVGPKAATPGTLPDAMTPCYYSFAGKKGDRFLLQANAVAIAPNMPNDGSVTDTVVTLYLPDKSTVWAIDDDAWPRFSTDSTLWTELPMDGTYYFTVEDCNALIASGILAAGSCATPTKSANYPGISVFDYNIAVYDVTASKGELVGSPSAPAVVKYTPVPASAGGKAGQYFDPTLDGDIAAATDVHTFTFTPPTNILANTNLPSRGRAVFSVQPTGSADGTGTNLNILITAKDMAGNILGQADQIHYTNGDNNTNGALAFSFPLDDQFGNKLGSPLTLTVTASPTGTFPAPTRNFYIIDHAATYEYYGQVEAEGPMGSALNDVPGMAQTLTPIKGQAAKTAAFAVDGNLSSATDVDWYMMTIPATAKNAGFSCEAARAGSGLRGFTAALYKDLGADGGAPTAIATLGPEAFPAKVDLNNGMGTGFTAGITTVWLKVSASAAPDATVKGTYYNCSANFQ